MRKATADRSSNRDVRSNKRMQLTKLRAAPVRRAEVPPCAPAGQMDGGTASQLIVRRDGAEREVTRPNKMCLLHRR